MTDHRALALLCPFLCSDCQSSVASLPVSCSAHSGESQAHHVKPDNVRPPYCEEAQACHTVTQQPDSSPLPPFQPRERGVGLGHSSCSRRTPQPEVRTGAADKTPRTAKATDGQSQNPRQILTEHLLDPRLCRGLRKQKSWACPVGCAASTHHTGAKARVVGRVVSRPGCERQRMRWGCLGILLRVPTQLWCRGPEEGWRSWRQLSRSSVTLGRLTHLSGYIIFSTIKC